MSKSATAIPPTGTISVANAVKPSAFPPEQSQRMEANALPAKAPTPASPPKPREWTVGDKVQLASGSPPLTVIHIISAGVFRVAWFNADGLPRTEQFPGAALVAAETTKASGN